MQKWYEKNDVDLGVIISSRVRLARNLVNIPFPSRMSDAEAGDVMEEIKASVFCESNIDKISHNGLLFLDLAHISELDKNVLAERHVVSPAMAQNHSLSCGLIYNNAENLSIMINEEDHIRIQSIFVGNDLDAAYDAASQLDDILSSDLDYAFNNNFGYLTSCPTNTGTGLRASYMLHLPLLEYTGQLKRLSELITKTGFVIRGANGEGTEPLGNVYQVSNQVTLGKTEGEIINSLKQLTNQIVDKEKQLQDGILKTMSSDASDKVWRAYGILSHCRKISLNEARSHLSDIRAGFNMGIGPMSSNQANPLHLKKTIYEIMTNIQPHNLQYILGITKDARQLDMMRADYLRHIFAR